MPVTPHGDPALGGLPEVDVLRGVGFRRFQGERGGPNAGAATCVNGASEGAQKGRERLCVAGVIGQPFRTSLALFALPLAAWH